MKHTVRQRIEDHAQRVMRGTELDARFKTILLGSGNVQHKTSGWIFEDGRTQPSPLSPRDAQRAVRSHVRCGGHVRFEICPICNLLDDELIIMRQLMHYHLKFCEAHL